jgi:hypothetical protein
MSNYIDLNKNGRLFPLWILSNFKKFQLPKNIIKDEEDPCKIKTKLELRQYQKFISSYLDYRSPYKEILLYHGLGSGKTATAINLINVLYNFNPYWNVFILIKASLKGSWEDEIRTWLSKDEYEARKKNIKFINYDSPYADKVFLDAIKDSDSTKKNFFIIDEAHNFINNLYNNIVSKTGKRAYVIYDYILKEKIENQDTMIVLMSGTPAINNPFELALMFNLMRPGIFPSSELKFNELYIKSNQLSDDMKNTFIRRIIGLISYYSGADKQLFAEKRIEFVYCNFHEKQQKTYEHFELIENKLDKNRFSNKVSSTYKSFTRQSSNFTFPTISSKINGESRPRPSTFKLDESVIQKMLEGIEFDEKDKEYVEYNDLINVFIKELEKYYDKLNDGKLKDDIEVFKSKYKYDFDKFWKEHKNKSKLLEEFYRNSCKITTMIFKTLNSKGPLILYSNYVRMEGLEIIKIYLKYLGFSKFVDTDKGKDYYRYTEYHGNINMETREVNKKFFNKSENIDGKLIKIILISPAGSEGISLKNVRQVHVLEPYWNEVRIDQLIGRSIRQCSHSDLPMNERYVNIFRYISQRENKKETTDENIQQLADKKNKLIGSFLKTLKEIAVDAELFRNHNIENNEYTPFQFNENSLFDEVISPAFKKNIDYDLNLENGLYSKNSEITKIDVFEIKAVVKLENNKFTDVNKYYLNNETGIVYDFDLRFPLGKINFDKDGVPEIFKDDIYLISQIIDIPKLKN